MARRYQFGWVLVELPGNADVNRVFLRLPAYVTHRMRALAQLPLNDLASPWSNRVRTHAPEPEVSAGSASSSSNGSRGDASNASNAAGEGSNPLLAPGKSPSDRSSSKKKKASSGGGGGGGEAAENAKLQARIQQLEAQIALMEGGDEISAAAGAGKLKDRGSNI